MSVFSSIPFANQTVYRIEFCPKHVPRPTVEKAKKGEGILQPTDPFPKTQPERQNEIEALQQKICEQYPSLQDHFIKPIRVEVVENTLKQDQKTTYRRDYDNVLGFQLSEMPKTLALPEDWDTPLTSQQISFRPPHIWGDIQSPKPFIPSENLAPNQKERAILCTTTGESNYMATHGKVASGILGK